MLAEVKELEVGRELIPHEFLGSQRNDQLTAPGTRHDSSSPVDRRAEVVALALLGLSRVRAHPHAISTGSGQLSAWNPRCASTAAPKAAPAREHDAANAS